MTGLGSPRFVSFLTAQFLGAVNDNAFKATLTTFVLWTVIDETAQVRYSSLATALFPVPFLLFSPIAGYLSDRFRKSGILPLIKLPELLAMALAIVALRAGSLPLLMTVLFLMATQSAFFSPAKYGLIPESVGNRDLSMANGLVHMTTNLAILIGSALGVLTFGLFKHHLERIGWIYLGIAVSGMLAALYVPRTPAGNRLAAREWLFLTSTWRDWRIVRTRPELVQSIWGIAYFYFLGSVFLAVIPVYGANVLELSVEGSAALLMVLSVGIAGGSLAAGRLSQGRIEIGLVPVGSLGMTIGSTSLALSPGGVAVLWGMPLGTVLLLLLLGFSAGLYFVPLNALLQQRSPEGMKGRLIAFSNVVTFSAVLAAGGLTWLLTDSLGFMSRELVLSVSLLTGVVTIYIFLLLPDYFVRSVLYVLTNLFYRIEVSGNRHLPAGGALLVANHVSWFDSLLIGTACDRMVRFLIYRPYYEAPGLHWLFRRMRAIPIASNDSAEQKESSLCRARQEIEQGNVVCVFAEGLEQIARDTGAPIVPVYLGGMWGSVFSCEGGRLLLKWPQLPRESVQVRFGRPLPATATECEVRRAIQELGNSGFAAPA